MKFTWFNLMPWPYLPDDFREKNRSVWVDIDQKLFDPVKSHEVYNTYMDLLEYAGTIGFDGIGVNEHHQNGYGIMPSPNIIAAGLARRTKDVALVVLGNSIALYNPPVRVAEEFAMLDCISGGRLVAGFPVGTSMDTNYCYGQIPSLTREKYAEAHDLIIKAWTTREPFAFNGRYNKLRHVNIWPRPIQQPHPPIWIPGTGSAGTLRDILQRDYAFVYLSWDGPKLVGRQIFDRYWQLAAELGRDQNPYRLAFLQVVAVSETDERAEREYAEHLQAHYRSGLGAIPATAMAVPGYAEPAAIEGMLRSGGHGGMLARMKTATYREIVDSQVAIVGSPATVADQIEAFVREFRIGNLLVMLQNGSMPRDLTEKNISLFAAEVLPRLRPIWDAEGWENHWWPRGQGTAGAVPKAAGAVPDAAGAVPDAAVGGRA